jgi:hypothetical protein
MVLVVITCHRTDGKVSADMATDRQAWNPIATAWTDAAKKNSRVEAARRRPQHMISYQHPIDDGEDRGIAHKRASAPRKSCHRGGPQS